ncbi:MAG TPA: NTP transferase domain-containing protein [Methanobacteriaceae archaeon]|nr:NTP transferase domain-containing protein [Methanobacteriaceae archaeon]
MEAVSAIVTAAGKNQRMREDLESRGIPYRHKLLLDLDEESVLEKTVKNVLAAGVGECVVVLGHYQEELLPSLEKIKDNKLRIVYNSDVEVELSQTLLNGVLNTITDYCLCVAADQPSVSTLTLENLIDALFQSSEPDNTISVLARRGIGTLESAEGLGMPFVCHRGLLMKYLSQDEDNLNPILRKMKSDGVNFYGVPHREEIELININRYEDYLNVQEELKKRN